MRTICVIPARWGSARYPGKPLAPIRGADGVEKPMLQRTWEIARHVFDLGDIFIATESTVVSDAARDFGARVVMTSPNARNGTERCAQVASVMALRGDDRVINLQGDAVMTPPNWVKVLATAPNNVSTIVQPLRRKATAGDVYAVLRHDMTAMYFSRSRIPFPHTDVEADLHLHIGVYGYPADALTRYAAWEPGPCERSEGLEQLRFLERNIPMHCIEPPPHYDDLHEVNAPADVALVEEGFRKWGTK